MGGELTKQKQIRPKKCAGCGGVFHPERQFQKACSVDCAYKVARINGEKKRAAQYLADKKRLKTRSDWTKEAQQAFNKWIRLRDGAQPCISCGSHTGKRNAGHYRSVGACPELRFEPNNCHVQCEKCNSWLSGNAIEYRINLVKKIGLPMVEWLESSHATKKYTIEQLKEIKAEYVRLAREIEKS